LKAGPGLSGIQKLGHGGVLETKVGKKHLKKRKKNKFRGERRVGGEGGKQIVLNHSSDGI